MVDTLRPNLAPPSESRCDSVGGAGGMSLSPPIMNDTDGWAAVDDMCASYSRFVRSISAVSWADMGCTGSIV
jgi:hypothetical protein